MKTVAPKSHKIQSLYPTLHDKLLLNMHSKLVDVDNDMDSFVGFMYFC